MARTEDGQEAERIAAYFRERVLPLATKVRADRGDLFPLGPDRRCGTYFIRRSRRTMERADFLGPSGLCPETLEEKLRALWQEPQLAELAELAPDLARLSRELAEAEEDGGEVSPFVYVMY